MAKPANLDPSVWVDRYGDYLFRYAMLRLRVAAAGASTYYHEKRAANIRFSW